MSPAATGHQEGPAEGAPRVSSQEFPIKEVVLYVKEEMKRNDLPETAVIGLLWTCIMNAVEWNKKEELVAEQALKHLKVQSSVGTDLGCRPTAALNM